MNGALAGQSIAAQPGQPLIVMPFSNHGRVQPVEERTFFRRPYARPSTRLQGGVQLSVIECEPAVWLNDVDGRDKPGTSPA
jgi:hypothetical protein